MNLREIYQELRREATILAGEPSDIPQRAALLHEIFLDSKGNHGFAEGAQRAPAYGADLPQEGRCKPGVRLGSQGAGQQR